MLDLSLALIRFSLDVAILALASVTDRRAHPPGRLLRCESVSGGAWLGARRRRLCPRTGLPLARGTPLMFPKCFLSSPSSTAQMIARMHGPGCTARIIGHQHRAVKRCGGLHHERRTHLRVPVDCCALRRLCQAWSGSRDGVIGPTLQRVRGRTGGAGCGYLRRQTQMTQDAADHPRILDERDQAQSPAALRTRQHIESEGTGFILHLPVWN